MSRLFTEELRSRRETLSLANMPQAGAATWQRARGWALYIGAAMAVHSDDNDLFRETGRWILHGVLTDDGVQG